MATDLAGNRESVRRGIRQAAEAGAHWVLTPELAVSGYAFAAACGTEWIGDPEDAWISGVERMTAEWGIAVFLGTPERDRRTSLLHNSLLAFDGRRGLVGRHRKVNTLRTGCEAWASPGTASTVVELDAFGGVGLLVCADACTPALGAAMKTQGARAIVSAANWAPGAWGPAGEWEAMTAVTGLPMFICNRTGPDPVLSFGGAESVVAARGGRLLSFSSPEPRLLLVDWDFGAARILGSRDTPLR